MEKKFKVKMVGIPNFLSIEMPPRLKQEGTPFNSNVISIASLSFEEIREYAEEVKMAFIERWNELKDKNNENEAIPR